MFVREARDRESVCEKEIVCVCERVKEKMFVCEGERGERDIVCV